MHKIFSKNLIVGKKVVYLPKCHSTNSLALQLATNEHASEGTVVISEEQLAGRGQRGNTWESEPGKNVLMSVILQPRFLIPTRQFFLTVVVSLAVRKTLSQYGLQNIKVKWPNDIYVGHRKIAGILIENIIKGNSIETSVLGIGLNVNQSSFISPRATSMLIELGIEINLEEFISELSGMIEGYYLQLRGGAFEALLKKYLSHLLGFGVFGQYRDNSGVFQGEILGVSEAGKLKVRKDTVIREYDLKEIEFLLS